MAYIAAMNGRKVLLVEDEPSVASFIQRSLIEEGCEISIAPDGMLGLAMAKEHFFDVIILDVMLPGMNGLQVCKQLRSAGIDTPVLILTALTSTENVVTGLDSGADDYMVKPFKLAELTARLRSLVRRKQNIETPEKIKLLSIADLVLNSDEKIVTRANKIIDLTATEFRLLEYLLKNKRRVLSRATILETVWDMHFDSSTKVVDVYINYLRKKIDKNFDPKLIHTAVGMGYVLKEVYSNEDTD
jgi:DNA-binding response OmpR family regulator